MAYVYKWRGVRSVLVFSVAVCLATAGCSNRTKNANASPAAPWIKAEPNPVPASPGSDKGTTTVSWDTGDGSNAEVYLQIRGKPDQLFSGGARYKKEAPWIKKGAKYEFVLYAGTEHKMELARVAVSGE